jgi:hypothetical protein
MKKGIIKQRAMHLLTTRVLRGPIRQLAEKAKQITPTDRVNVIIFQDESKNPRG